MAMTRRIPVPSNRRTWCMLWKTARGRSTVVYGSMLRKTATFRRRSVQPYGMMLSWCDLSDLIVCSRHAVVACMVHRHRCH